MDLNSREELIEHPENNFKTNVTVFNILKEQQQKQKQNLIHQITYNFEK